MTVAQLLAQSHAAHLLAQKCRRERHVVGHWQAISEALERRLQAHTLDPEHHDPAWQAEIPKKFLHDACLEFYRHELGIAAERPLVPVAVIDRMVEGPTCEAVK